MFDKYYYALSGSFNFLPCCAQMHIDKHLHEINNKEIRIQKHRLGRGNWYKFTIDCKHSKNSKIV